MLELDQNLPAGALLDTGGEAFAERVKACRAIWFRNTLEAFDVDDLTRVVTGWKSTGGAHLATPAAPNTGNGKLTEDPVLGLQTQSEINCGYVVPKITQNARTFTMTVVYHPQEGALAKTLLTVNTGYAGGKDQDSNYLFLSDDGDVLTLKDVRGKVEIAANAITASERRRVVTISLSGSRLALAIGTEAAVVEHGQDPEMATTADLFIGCRSHRSGLKKTLGAATVSEVLFWPHHALLLPRTAEDRAACRALKRYLLWEHVARDIQL